MTVRMKDIATDLNLSKMTISKVLRGQMDVSDKTKARVLQRIKELNYRPNISARSFRTGQTFNVGLVLPSLIDPFFSQLTSSIVSQLRLANYSVFLSSTEYESELEQKEIEQHLSRQVDALIIASVQNSNSLNQLMETSKSPFVYLPCEAPLLNSNSVYLRMDEVGYIAAEHLVKVGCRRIAIVRGPRGVSADLRLKGFRDALAESKLGLHPALTVAVTQISSDEYQQGRRSAEMLLQAKQRPDGIACHTDMTAIGLMDHFVEAGIRIPQEVAVIGCGNSAQLCEMRVPLSSVDMSAAEIGIRAAKQTLKFLSGRKLLKFRNIAVSPTLVVRTSTEK